MTVRNILLTGIHEFLGKLVLQRLLKESSVGRILTLDPGPAPKGRKLKSLKSALGDENLPSLLKKERVHTIVHLPLAGRADFETAVMGSMNLLGAAAHGGVRRVIFGSSLCVYGALPNNPNYISEARRTRIGGKTPHARHASEIERYAQDFMKNFPEISLTLLRFAPIVGPTSTSPLMRYLHPKKCPVLLGFDPLFQLLHEEDAASAVIAALRSGASGPVNIAPDGVAPLLKILRFLGKTPIPVLPPLARLSQKLLRTPVSFDPSFLQFMCCGDNEKMKTGLKFVPQRSSSEALRALEA